MLDHIVKNYKILDIIEENDYQFDGSSCAIKPIIFHLSSDHSQACSILDIGFGRGELGQLVKTNPSTSHWEIDGIDGFKITCSNKALFEKGYYRNIWHGYAQELQVDQIKSYDIVCLLDVIEHLDAVTAKKLLRNLLESLGEKSLLFISTPLWFMPQSAMQVGDLEEHLIGVPASSMLALKPLMYSVGAALVGNFIFDRRSLAYIDDFIPTTDRSFDINQGEKVALDAGMKLENGILYIVSY
jgi:2-polyprenyl-3-methyl-5-hydroxy-6-metoxy-1,4-benzoquinol methylase